MGLVRVGFGEVQVGLFLRISGQYRTVILCALAPSFSSPE